MKTLLTVGSVILLAGCAAIQVRKEAELVRLTKTEPTGCQYLGEATGNQGNMLTGPFTSNARLETGARNRLKNKAHEMGGNVVVLLTDRAGNTGSLSSGSGSIQQTNVVLSGTVYRCPNDQ